MDAILEALKQQSLELEALKQRLPEPMKIPRPLEIALEIGLPLLLAGIAFKLGMYFASPLCP